MKPFIYAGLLLSVVAAGAANATEKPIKPNNSNTAVAGAAASSKSNASATGVGVGVGKGGSAKSSSNSDNDVAVSQDGDKTDNFGLAIAPPAFSYAPGAAVGECVATESYAIGLPLVGGGWGQQTLVMLPACVPQLEATLRLAYGSPIAMAAACQSKFAHNALSSLNVDCDTAPVSEAGE